MTSDTQPSLSNMQPGLFPNARLKTPKHKTLMQAGTLIAPGQIRIDTVPIPEPGPEEVRIRLEGCGVCGSNLPAWEGRSWFKYPLAPGELGHEGWGRIDALGRNVSGLAEGQRVAVLSYHAYSQYDLAPATNVVPLPPGLNNRPFPGEALGCAVNVFRRCDIRPAQKVAVVGVGFLGAVLVSLAANAGAEVIAITRRSFALEIAKKLGAAHTIEMHDHWTIVEQVKEITKGRGCERVIEAAGQQWPLDVAAELTAERGRLIIAGYHQDGPRQVNMQLWNWRGLDVINAHERDPAIYIEGIRFAMEAVSSGLLDPSPLYTHRFKLNDLACAFDTMKSRPEGFMKALITL